VVLVSALGDYCHCAANEHMHWINSLEVPVGMNERFERNSTRRRHVRTHNIKRNLSFVREKKGR
jgi:hypothetical protein